MKKYQNKLADGLLREEMAMNMNNERMKEKQMERKLNSNNLKAYVPLFNNLGKVIESGLSFEKAIVYLYDSEIDHLFSVPQIGSDNDLNYKDIIKMHSKRGFLGKVFTEGEASIVENKHDIEKFLEFEEQTLSVIDPQFQSINNTVGIPIESKIDDKIVGVLQLYNHISKNNDQQIEKFISSNQPIIDHLNEFLANLISQSEKTRKIMKINEIQSGLLDISNDALIQTDSETKIGFCSKSVEILFGRKQSEIIGITINDLLNDANPEIGLMIKNVTTQNYKDHILIEAVNFYFKSKNTEQRIRKNLTEYNKSMSQIDKSKNELGSVKVNFLWYKLSKGLYNLGHLFIIQPIIMK